MLRKLVIGTLAAIGVVAVGGYAAFQLSPWPSALFYRYLMDRGGVAAARALERHVPPGVAAWLNERYDPRDGDALFDVFYPETAGGRALPTVVWVHGGGFLSGSKDQIANYLKIIAAAGYTVVGVNYTLAPRANFPAPVRQVNAALAHLLAHAARFNIDPSRLFLAGDSAGAQIAAQLAIVTSSPDHAKALAITPALQRAQLRGVILHCGVYDPQHLKAEGPFAGFLQAVGWSYFGVRDFLKDPRMAQFSVVGNVTADFPPVFISAGNADPLGVHSHLLADAAEKLGVAVDRLFFPADYQPPLAHEYQFNLDIAAGQLALKRGLAFLKARAQ